MCDCPNELEADMRERFGVNIRRMREVGVAHVATLAFSLLEQGTRVAGHYDELWGWSRSDVLAGRIIDSIAEFAWGLGGGEGEPPESILPHSHTAPMPGKSVHKGIAIPIDEFDKLFGIGDGEAWQHQ